MSKLKEKIFVIDDDVYIGDMLEEALRKRDTRFSVPIPGQKRFSFWKKKRRIWYFLT